MTKFEELSETVTRSKNKSKIAHSDNGIEENLEVAGSEITKSPLISFGDYETDMDLIYHLCLKGKYKQPEGQSADFRET